MTKSFKIYNFNLFLKCYLLIYSYLYFNIRVELYLDMSFILQGNKAKKDMYR